jgi:large subunit ribosomal protein L28
VDEDESEFLAHLLLVEHSIVKKEQPNMASVCELCGKSPSFGMSVSHSHRRTKRRWDPNIQRVRALIDGSPKRINVCTSCMRAGRVTKPPRRQIPASK